MPPNVFEDLGEVWCGFDRIGRRQFLEPLVNIDLKAPGQESRDNVAVPGVPGAGTFELLLLGDQKVAVAPVGSREGGMRSQEY